MGTKKKAMTLRMMKGVTPFSTDKDDIPHEFASPHELMGKIILKHKMRNKAGRPYHADLTSLAVHGRAQSVKGKDMGKARVARGTAVITSVNDVKARKYLDNAKCVAHLAFALTCCLLFCHTHTHTRARARGTHTTHTHTHTHNVSFFFLFYLF